MNIVVKGKAKFECPKCGSHAVKIAGGVTFSGDANVVEGATNDIISYELVVTCAQCGYDELISREARCGK